VLDNWDKTFFIAPIGAPPGSGGAVSGRTPRCAVLNFGEIPCPIRASIPADGRCYVQVPGRDADFKPAPCTHEAFTPPVAIDCSRPELTATCDQASKCRGDTCDLVKKYIDPLIVMLSALVGIGVTLSIIWSGIHYSKSANDSRAVAQAKRRILAALLTLLGYFLLYQFLDWVIPGGIG
jgi:hypothetical protein